MARNKSVRSVIRGEDKEAPEGKGRGHKRTPRACDRCRFKKSKCDGSQPCMTCQSTDRTCIFSARRRRDARNWYCGMQEVVDEAFQRLYRACKESNSFPGTLPIEQDGKVTTEGILRGLGLATVPAPFDNPESLSPSASAHTVVPLVFPKTNVDNGTGVRKLQQKRTELSIESGSATSIHDDRSSSVLFSPVGTEVERAEQMQITSPMSSEMSKHFDDVLDAYPWSHGDFTMNPFEATRVVKNPSYQQDHVINAGVLNGKLISPAAPYPVYVPYSLP